VSRWIEAFARRVADVKKLILKCLNEARCRPPLSGLTKGQYGESRRSGKTTQGILTTPLYNLQARDVTTHERGATGRTRMEGIFGLPRLRAAMLSVQRMKQENRSYLFPAGSVRYGRVVRHLTWSAEFTFGNVGEHAIEPVESALQCRLQASVGS
jgi:hypothetical protein